MKYYGLFVVITKRSNQKKGAFTCLIAANDEEHAKKRLFEIYDLDNADVKIESISEAADAYTLEWSGICPLGK